VLRCRRAHDVRSGGCRGINSGRNRDQFWVCCPPCAKLVAVGNAHEVAVPRGLNRLPNRISNPAGRGSELPMEYLWPQYSVRITIERAGDEPIFSALPLPGAPTVGAESSPDTN
jgi:hypothetical protein